MDQEWLSERETRAWIGFQRMRIEVHEVLARRLAISRSPSASAVARWSHDSCEAGKLMELRNAER
jgi:hypothetical protein